MRAFNLNENGALLERMAIYLGRMGASWQLSFEWIILLWIGHHWGNWFITKAVFPSSTTLFFLLLPTDRPKLRNLSQLLTTPTLSYLQRRKRFSSQTGKSLLSIFVCRCFQFFIEDVFGQVQWGSWGVCGVAWGCDNVRLFELCQIRCLVCRDRGCGIPPENVLKRHRCANRPHRPHGNAQ